MAVAIVDDPLRMLTVAPGTPKPELTIKPVMGSPLVTTESWLIKLDASAERMLAALTDVTFTFAVAKWVVPKAWPVTISVNVVEHEVPICLPACAWT